MKMLKSTNSLFTFAEDQWMPEFGIFGKIGGDSTLKNEFEKDWEKPINKEQRLDTKNFANELEKLTNANKELKNRLAKIENELAKKHSLGIQNLIFSHDVIDEIWDEEDDTL